MIRFYNNILNLQIYVKKYIQYRFDLKNNVE